MSALLLALALALPLALAACGDAGERTDTVAEPRLPALRPAVHPAAEPAATDQRSLVVFLGDSLTAGFGLGKAEAFPALIEEALGASGHDVRVVNAGVSGDTTAGGASRLDWVLRQRPDVLVVALGGNDGLRGVDLGTTEENLRRIIVRAREAGARVLLAGMLIPPSYGPDYTERFAAIYPRLATELDVPLIPFLLEGVGGDPALNQADGIHPNAEGQRRIAELVAPYLETILAELEPAAPATPDRATAAR